jgi:hypothetical protein
MIKLSKPSVNTRQLFQAALTLLDGELGPCLGSTEKVRLRTLKYIALAFRRGQLIENFG